MRSFSEFCKSKSVTEDWQSIAAKAAGGLIGAAGGFLGGPFVGAMSGAKTGADIGDSWLNDMRDRAGDHEPLLASSARKALESVDSLRNLVKDIGKRNPDIFKKLDEKIKFQKVYQTSSIQTLDTITSAYLYFADLVDALEGNYD